MVVKLKKMKHLKLVLSLFVLVVFGLVSCKTQDKEQNKTVAQEKEALVLWYNAPAAYSVK